MRHLAAALGVAVVAAAILAPRSASARREQTLAGRTHNFLAPTGELVPKGGAEVELHQLAFYNQLAFGLTDNIELSISAPAVPMAGFAGVRVGLLPRSSRARLVVGGGVGMPLMGDSAGDGDRLYWISATAAVQTNDLNLHATLMAIHITDEDAPEMLVANAGVSFRTGPGSALVFDVGQLRIPAVSVDCAGNGPECHSSDDDVIRGGLVGLKLLDANFDADLGLLVPVIGHTAYIAIPLVSMTYRW